jgi:uncharacterized protein
MKIHESPISHSQNYLNASHQGKNHWWRYLISIILILFFYLIIGSLALAIIIAVSNTNISGAEFSNSALLNKKFASFLKIPSLGAYVAVNMPSLFGVIGLLIAIIFIHQRNPTSMVRADGIIKWNKIFTGFLVWLVINCLFSGISYILNPQDYIFSFTKDWFISLPLAFVLTPIQTSFEELLIRGYFMQGMALVIHKRVMIVIVNGMIFMLPHLGNPELARGGILAIYYFVIGAFLAALAIRDNGLELPLGIHAANNLFLLVVNPKDSALPIPSIWQLQNCPDPMISVVTSLVSCTIVYYIFFGKSKDFKKLS